MHKTVAVIDVGSNSIKLLVVQASESKRNLKTLFSETLETRISAGISHKLPRLTKEAITAGTDAIVKLLRMAQNYQPDGTEIVATSAVRDAVNGNEFVEAVYEATGLFIQILSGREEATYIGRGISYDPFISDMASFIQTDIGGGSMELIRFEGGQIVDAISLQLGAVRLTEQFIVNRSIPIRDSVERVIRQHVHEVLNKSRFDFSPETLPLVATGGAYTVSRAVLAAKANLEVEDSSPLLQRNDLRQLKNDLMMLPLHERMTTPHLPATRADIIPTALITIDTLLDHSRRSHLTHSFYNLRYGIAAQRLFHD